MHIAAAPIALGARAGDHALALEHAEMMGDEVRGEAKSVLQLPRRKIAKRQQVDDSQPSRVGERGMACRASLDLSSLSAHCLNLD